MERLLNIAGTVNATPWRLRSFIAGRPDGGLGYRIHPMPETKPRGPAVALART